jgi:pyrroline-5-carboxylate reductase
MSTNGRRIAILGGGKIGESLLSGLLSSGWRKPDEIVVTGRRQERIDELAERYGVEATLSNPEAVSGAAFIVIAVKPQDFEVLLGEVGSLISPEQTVRQCSRSRPRCRQRRSRNV